MLGLTLLLVGVIVLVSARHGWLLEVRLKADSTTYKQTACTRRRSQPQPPPRQPRPLRQPRQPRQPSYNRLMFRYAPAALVLASAIGTIAIGCGKTGPPAETDRPVTTTSAQERDIHSYP